MTARKILLISTPLSKSSFITDSLIKWGLECQDHVLCLEASPARLSGAIAKCIVTDETSPAPKLKKRKLKRKPNL